LGALAGPELPPSRLFLLCHGYLQSLSADGCHRLRSLSREDDPVRPPKGRGFLCFPHYDRACPWMALHLSQPCSSAGTPTGVRDGKGTGRDIARSVLTEEGKGRAGGLPRIPVPGAPRRPFQAAPYHRDRTITGSFSDRWRVLMSLIMYMPCLFVTNS
jgi:hypothetical protein